MFVSFHLVYALFNQNLFVCYVSYHLNVCAYVFIELRILWNPSCRLHNERVFLQCVILHGRPSARVLWRICHRVCTYMVWFHRGFFNEFLDYLAPWTVSCIKYTQTASLQNESLCESWDGLFVNRLLDIKYT